MFRTFWNTVPGCAIQNGTEQRLYESGKNRRQAPFRQSQGTNRLFDSYAGQTQAYAYAELMSALKTCALATAWPRGLYILMHPTPPRQEI